MLFTREQLGFVHSRRVGYLSTVDDAGLPHVIPVCFAIQGDCVYSPIDQKPKKTHNLKRLRNIRSNPHVSLLLDRYGDDWSTLGWVLVRGIAWIAYCSDTHVRAVELLRDKYVQYREMSLQEHPVICIDVKQVISWGNLIIT